MHRDIANPTTNEYGADTHPAFGMIRAGRVSSSPPGQVLFDSDIRHQHTVRIQISTADRRRDLNSDYIHEGKQLIEVELSEAQWASFVSSMNTSGVPCTLRATENDYQVPGLPYDPRLAVSMAEVKGAADKLMSSIKTAMAEYEQAIADKAGVKVIKEKLRALHFVIENSGSNMTFAAQQLNEHTENVVQRARADIEAMVYAEANRLGLTAGEAQGLLELPAMPGEHS